MALSTDCVCNGLLLHGQHQYIATSGGVEIIGLLSVYQYYVYDKNKCLITYHIFDQKGRPFELAVDVGCGSGQGTVLLAKHFASVTGTDVSPAQLEVAAQHAQAPNITYR